MLKLLVASCLLTGVFGVYTPGTPGGPWSKDELLVVKAKLYRLYRLSLAPKAVRLGFHDCLKYNDGTGGCDGCLNWEGVDVDHNPVMMAKNMTNVDSSDNNGLGSVVRELERVYREPSYPHLAPKLGQSLFESGKSRADLWAYAALVGVEYGIETTNLACDNTLDERIIKGSCIHDDGDNCKVNPSREFVFQYGRSDCTDHDTVDTYKTSKMEAHPNPVANGVSTSNFFRDFFSFSGRETAAIFGAHTFGKPHVGVSLFPYTWTSSGIHLFNNDYYKSIVGQPRWFFDDPLCQRVGNAFNQKPESRWLAHSRKFTNRGGPVMWIHQNLVCPSLYNPGTILSNYAQACVDEAPEGQLCCADPVAGSSEPRTVNQADGDVNLGCERFRLINGNDEIALNCEMGLYREFEVTDGVIHGCPGLEHFNASMANDKNRAIWSQIPGVGMAQPECAKQRHAEPAGSTPLYQIMEEYANDQTAWINDFIPAMEKMLHNGYTSLTDGPDYHANVYCPLPPIYGDLANTDVLCYEPSPASNMEPFIVENRLSALAGKVYQYNSTTGIFDFGYITGASNQQWRISENGRQLINAATGLPLLVSGNVNWNIEQISNDIILTNPLTNRVVDCYQARTEGQPCITWTKHGGPNQRFYSYEPSPASNMEPFMIANRLSALAGKVYQYNVTTRIFDFGYTTGASNQQWRISENGRQLINEATGLPLLVSGNVNWNIEKISDDIILTDLLTNRVVDCYPARTEGQPCITWTKHGGSNQRFYVVVGV